jgi:hypothetical protein
MLVHVFDSNKMPPVLSKPSQTAKQFVFRVTSGDKMKTMLRKVGSTYQAMVNKNLCEAETNHVANAIMVDVRMSIPIVGCGNGHDLVNKAL